METTALNAFLAIVGAMLVPIIPIEYLQVFDTTPGRFSLLIFPVMLFHYVSPQSGVMGGVISGIVLDRVHDLSPKSTKPKRERDEILVDLSPDYSEMVTDEIVMLEPVNIRRKHGVR
jgi:hypothetical protein